MRRVYMVSMMAILLVGCNNSSPKQNLNGEKLLNQKCSKCHNLDMPPKSYENEIAPSMMAVTFHMKDFIKSDNPSEHEMKIVNFVKDYVISPSEKKSLCDKESLKSYGVMPSQKGSVTEDELKAIAHYLYATYDNQKLLKAMAEKQRLAKMSVKERVFEQQHCQYCHKIDKDGIAPSFKMIANRYSKEQKSIIVDSIENGSKGKWEGKSMPMLGFKDMSSKDINSMADWILGLKE